MASSSDDRRSSPGTDVDSAQLTRAGTAREGREFGMNLEEYLTPVEEVEHMKAALAYYDDQNLLCCLLIERAVAKVWT